MRKVTDVIGLEPQMPRHGPCKSSMAQLLETPDLGLNAGDKLLLYG